MTTNLPNLPLTESPTDAQIAAGRAKVARIGRMLFERHLTDAAGGNVSLRVGNRVCISPRYSGQSRQWQLEPDDVLVTDLERNILAGAGQLSREANAHYRMHNEFGTYGTAIIHAHAKNLLVFAATNRPLPPVLEATRKFGVTPVVKFAPAHSPKLAENIVKAIHGRESIITKQAAAVIAPWHGLFLIGKDMDSAFDAAERLDTNAYIIMMGGMLIGQAAMDAIPAQMESIIGGFQE